MKGNFVKETSLTTGAVLTITLVEVANWTRLSAVASIAIGDTFEYTLFNSAGKEVGIGTKQAGNTFDRTTVISTLVGATYNDSTAVKLTLVGESEFFITLSAESTMDINNTVFNKSLWKSTATLLGTATDNHVNLGGGTSVTGTAVQAYDFCGVLSGEDNTTAGPWSVVTGGFGGLNLGEYSIIGSGFNNQIQAGCSVCIIGCGNANLIQATVINGHIGGGKSNNLNNHYTSIGGGLANLSYGQYACTPGGRGNRSSHTHSQAGGGGSYTRANFDWVWGASDTSTPSVANNVARLTSAGDWKIDGAVSSPEADIAECVEWADGNPSNEDRNGLITSIFEGKLILGDSNPSGIISAAPSLISNAAPNGWAKTYLKDKHKRNVKTEYTKIEWVDEWAEPQYVYEAQDGTLYAEYPQVTAVNGIVSGLTPIGKLKKEIVFTRTINPLFDITKVEDYKPRNERKEWGVVGVLGQIVSNTSENITGWKVDADPDKPGYFKNGTTYDVMEHIDETTVLVFYK